MKNWIKSKCPVKSVFSKHAFRVCTVFLKISKIFPRLRFNFPGLKSSPQNLSFPRFQIQFTLPSTYNTYNINSENFIACVKQISETLLDIHSFSLVLENALPPPPTRPMQTLHILFFFPFFMVKLTFAFEAFFCLSGEVESCRRRFLTKIKFC